MAVFSLYFQFFWTFGNDNLEMGNLNSENIFLIEELQTANDSSIINMTINMTLNEVVCIQKITRTVNLVNKNFLLSNFILLFTLFPNAS